MTWIMAYIALGSAVGFLAGLLGIGGGLLIVPMLTFLFTAQGFAQEYILHLALGTSLASIAFTSVSSLWSHHKRNAVIWKAVISITPGIIIGTFGGSYIAARLSTHFLKGFFSLFLYYVATQMLIGMKPKPTRTLPKTPGMIGAGGIIGAFSSLVGIGGGSLSVPFLSWCNASMHQAIGTSAAIGFPIAVSGGIGYVVNGLKVSGLPPHTLGFVHLTSLFGIAATSVLTAPLGAKLAHRMPVDKLKKLFAFLLYVIATKMFVSLL
ncbi:MAG: sulfite exporter TauE/SafE family protein [Desulfobacteraceae bacterium]|jgi:hypothetical protein